MAACTSMALPNELKSLLKTTIQETKDAELIETRLLQRAQANMNTYLKIINMRLIGPDHTTHSLETKIDKLMSYIVGVSGRLDSEGGLETGEG